MPISIADIFWNDGGAPRGGSYHAALRALITRPSMKQLTVVAIYSSV